MSAPPLVGRIDAALDRGATFLEERQAEDGSWRSLDYGAFKDGYSITPYALSALFFAPPKPGRPAAYARGVDFVATLDPELRHNYPEYSLSGAIIVLSADRNARHRAARDKLLDALRGRQLTEQHGWQPDDLAYGGWGYWTDDLTRPRDLGGADPILSSNLSATLFAVGALQMGGVPRDDPIFAKARRFVERCQNFAPGDGGFFFTPTNTLQNKAGDYRSYGSMTADGLRALVRVGAENARIAAAQAWLAKHFDPDQAPGDYPPASEVQRRSVYHYWIWTAAHALMLQGDRDRLARLADAVLARQRPDGSWSNASTDLREDDPLVATPFAMAALGIARFVQTGRWATVFGPR